MRTAMQTMYDELMKHEYTIPLELIIKCKELIRIEEWQMKHAHCEGAISGLLDLKITPKQYYEQKYEEQ
jgi:hypothetical protein